MDELNKYCHECGKKVVKYDFLCNECYKKTKFHWFFNFLAFSFGFTEILLAIWVLISTRKAKLDFYKWIKIGVIASCITFLLIFCLRLLSISGLIN